MSVKGLTKGYGRDRKNLFQREFLLQCGFLWPNKPIQDGGEAKAPLWLNRLSGTNWLTNWLTNEQTGVNQREAFASNKKVKVESPVNEERDETTQTSNTRNSKC